MLTKSDGFYIYNNANLATDSYLGEDSLQAPITAVACTAELITQLQDAQDDFEDFRVVYQTAKGKEKKLESATTIKKRMVVTINDKLVVHLRAMSNVDEALYGGFVKNIRTKT